MNALTSDSPETMAGRPPGPPAPQFHIPNFEGPLDLLLHLIRAHEVEISDIPIAEITQQYLAYMEMWEALDLTIAGEYVVIAATLIEIKSRMLLPQAPPVAGEEGEEDDPRAELVARLREYQVYKGTVETLRTWEELRRELFFRGALENVDDYILPVPAGEANVQQLFQALNRLLAEAGIDEKTVTSVTPRRRLSLRMKMAEIVRKLTSAGPEGMGFEALFVLPCPRYDIVLTFLALLELLRMQRVAADQVKPLEPIKITLLPEPQEGRPQ
jgi:segregation and condensation protein A